MNIRDTLNEEIKKTNAEIEDLKTQIEKFSKE